VKEGATARSSSQRPFASRRFDTNNNGRPDCEQGERSSPLNRSLRIIEGCVSGEEHAAQASSADDDACENYGAQGSQDYVQCRTLKDQQRQANKAALASAILSRPTPQPYVLPMPHGY
jgi:hypothetical protein